MAQETTNNLWNDCTIRAEKFDEKLPASTDRSANKFVSSDVDNCINNFRRSEKKRILKNIAAVFANYKKIINCRRFHC